MTAIPPMPRTCGHNAIRYVRCPRCGQWVCAPCLDAHEAQARTQADQPCPVAQAKEPTR